VKGNHAEHWLNGMKTVEFEFGSEELKAGVAKKQIQEHAGLGHQNQVAHSPPGSRRRDLIPLDQDPETVNGFWHRKRGALAD
jgi:hypothetical protein